MVSNNIIMKEQKVIYYHDELNDEFSKAKITPIKIDKNYHYYKKGFFYRLSCFFYYRIVALPIAIIYCKCKFHNKYVNKKVLKDLKETGAFLYGNHTQAGADAVLPTLMSFPKVVYVITHANNVSMKGLRRATPRLGAIPLPDDLEAMRNFKKTIELRLKEKSLITIYPEAHIWPYYNKIRNFPATSFHYPVQYELPTYCFTNVYMKRKHSSKANIVTYIDGPFYPNKDLDRNGQIQDLRDQVYKKMVERASLSNIEYVKYVKDKE
jgi:1-acyl-sn-glycerol-3-phosphate acyltransferase